MIKVELVYALPTEQELLTLEVAEGSTVRDVIMQSGILQRYPEIDLGVSKVGIFSKIISLEKIIKVMDRIEIYRPLTIDPVEARRLRAPSKKKSNKSNKDCAN